MGLRQAPYSQYSPTDSSHSMLYGFLTLLSATVWDCSNCISCAEFFFIFASPVRSWWWIMSTPSSPRVPSTQRSAGSLYTTLAGGGDTALSLADGIRELDLILFGALLIKRASARLDLPQITVAVACVFYHRFCLAKNLTRYDHYVC